MGYKFEKYSIGGGGSGGSGIIDVTELPTENIDENAFYRVSESGTDIRIAIEGMKMTFAEFYQSMGVSLTCIYYEVDAMPTAETMDAADLTALIVPIYIYEGIGYIYNWSDNGAVLTVGGVLGGFPDLGVATDWDAVDATDVAQMGVYAVSFSTETLYKYTNGELLPLEFAYPSVYYVLSEDGTYYTATGNINSNEKSATISATYKELPVKAINCLGCILDTVSIEEGIEQIYFTACSRLKMLTLPSTTDRIRQDAFSLCTGLEEITIPDSVTSIDYNAFNRCSALSSITLPSNLQYIDSNAFYLCTALEQLEIPASVTTINDEAFYGCDGIIEVVFKGTPTAISATAFKARIDSIRVPWAEGAVANAPWGATNATIHYESTT